MISYAFKKTGKSEVAKRVWELGNHGNELAAYLVNSNDWTGIYINPDVYHPSDADNEHTFSNVVALKRCTYYKVPLTYRVANYNPTPKSHWAFEKLNRDRGVTKLNAVDIGKLKTVKFGFGISRGGMHTWLFSKGYVYEVHWDKIGANLYEKSPLEFYPWLSGAIVVPRDAIQAFKLDELKCSAS